MSLGLALVVVPGLALIGLARWRAYQWRRSPLAQANVPLARRRPAHPEQLTPGDAALLLAIAAALALAWAAAPLGAR